MAGTPPLARWRAPCGPDRADNVCSADIQDRIHAGIARAKAQGTKSGKPIGRPRLTRRMEEIVRAELANGTGILKTARQLRLGASTVQRIKGEMAAASVEHLGTERF